MATVSQPVMLDTNTISQLMQGHRTASRRLAQTAVDNVLVSAISEGELRYGLAKRPSRARLRIAAELFKRVRVVSWSSDVAWCYGTLRAELERRGRPLASMDTQIAAHALTLGCTLITDDRAFARIDDLRLDNWLA